MLFFRKDDVNETDALAELRRKVEGTDLPEAARNAIAVELEKLQRTDPSVAEFSIGANYIDYLLGLPWTALSKDNLDLKRAENVLDNSHAGLGQVRDRVLEFLAQRTMFARRTASILMVDDEPIARNNLKLFLSREGYSVETASNGLEALDRMRQWEFDLVITDLKMDRMDGMELLAHTAKISPDTKVMIVTGYATVDTAVKAMQTGAVHYLSKPIDLGELRTAVQNILAGSNKQYTTKSPVLCFVGPPGVGKTSVGRAVAEALGRTFCRISLADLRDEAELRGHRRTYAGAMPGRIIQAIASAKVRNPVFMLDEMDKIGQDVKGDPASVMLELLDPEQNDRFLDRYLDIPFDLSSVLFVATANSLDRLVGPVLDRMEVVPFTGYSEKEKLEIASRFLAPRQLRSHGLTQPTPRFSNGALSKIISCYTNEAGVRGLEREIGRVCRKLARICLEENRSGYEQEIGSETVCALLGPPPYAHEAAEAEPRIGAATGLVWSETGGEIVSVEASRMPGSGQLLLTGSLGEILKESAHIALSHIRANAERLGVDAHFFRNQDIHIHIPAGGVSKDGPSAGVTIFIALVSLLTARPIRSDLAFSGEISLSGRVLRVAGVREKLLAAVRGGVQTVVLPRDNGADVEAVRVQGAELPEVILAGSVDQALALAMPETGR